MPGHPDCSRLPTCTHASSPLRRHGAYLRVSTEKQADRGVSLDAQRTKVKSGDGVSLPLPLIRYALQFAQRAFRQQLLGDVGASGSHGNWRDTGCLDLPMHDAQKARSQGNIAPLRPCISTASLLAGRFPLPEGDTDDQQTS